MKSGVLMIDNPRLQKVGIKTASDRIAETFPDIFERATGYRFSGLLACTGTGLCSAGSCEVRDAFFIPTGKLSPARA
jgi:putative ribosome biogenesis GTPase RsgA